MSIQSIIANAKEIVTNKFFCFEGRAGRAEYWQFVLAAIVVNLVLGIVDSVIGIRLFISLFSLAILFPMLGCTARRLHDIGQTGWLQLLGLIPLVGTVIVLVLCVKAGDPSANRYGEAAH